METKGSKEKEEGTDKNKLDFSLNFFLEGKENIYLMLIYMYTKHERHNTISSLLSLMLEHILTTAIKCIYFTNLPLLIDKRLSMYLLSFWHQHYELWLNIRYAYIRS